MRYWIVVEGKPVGPLSFEEFKQYDIQPGTFVKIEGMPDYQEAAEIPQLRELFGFTLDFTSPQYFASFDQRLLASAIDWFLLTTLVILFDFLWVLLVSDSQIWLILSVNILLIPVIKFFYHIISEARWQVTIGKRLLNIKVTDLNGQKPTLSMIIVRNFCKVLSALLLFTGYLYSFFNKKQQCLHDKIAQTLVIKERLI